MKTLIGTWKGKTDLGAGPVEITTEYRVLAAGSVPEERVFPGTPNEMVTIYYDKDGEAIASILTAPAARSIRRRNRTCTG